MVKRSKNIDQINPTLDSGLDFIRRQLDSGVSLDVTQDTYKSLDKCSPCAGFQFDRFLGVLRDRSLGDDTDIKNRSYKTVELMEMFIGSKSISTELYDASLLYGMAKIIMLQDKQSDDVRELAGITYCAYEKSLTDEAYRKKTRRILGDALAIDQMADDVAKKSKDDWNIHDGIVPKKTVDNIVKNTHVESIVIPAVQLLAELSRAELPDDQARLATIKAKEFYAPLCHSLGLQFLSSTLRGVGSEHILVRQGKLAELDKSTEIADRARTVGVDGVLKRIFGEDQVVIVENLVELESGERAGVKHDRSKQRKKKPFPALARALVDVGEIKNVEVLGRIKSRGQTANKLVEDGIDELPMDSIGFRILVKDLDEMAEVFTGLLRAVIGSEGVSLRAAVAKKEALYIQGNKDKFRSPLRRKIREHKKVIPELRGLRVEENPKDSHFQVAKFTAVIKTPEGDVGFEFQVQTEKDYWHADRGKASDAVYRMRRATADGSAMPIDIQRMVKSLRKLHKKSEYMRGKYAVNKLPLSKKENGRELNRTAKELAKRAVEQSNFRIRAEDGRIE